ncbi:hypothetical protein QQS21_009955 [Conoideocrella luteorostrata]|uniref:Uncharacterized protein n=1 Tax=Conoideocrella luteorostrata TaxID=1105319 RepID=A0AAJ0CG29_9HYPO|nr:hypothetical protein QQS21_009955 [Conoideocrella luteorostrata]
MKSVPLLWQKLAPDQQFADYFLENMIQDSLRPADAKHLLYQAALSKDYDPRPPLRSIEALLVAIDSADDQVNLPEVPVLEHGVQQVQIG